MSLKKRKVIKRKINKKNKGVSKFKIILIAFLLSVIIGKATSANEDIDSILTNWFNNQRSQSISEMEKEVNVEKEILIKQLKEDLGSEFLATEVSLDNFTIQETEKSIEELKRYTEELKIKLRNENDGKETEITLYLDGVLEEAIAQMKTLEAIHLQNQETKIVEPIVEKEETQIEEQIAPIEKTESEEIIAPIEETEVVDEKVETTPEITPVQPEPEIEIEPTPEPVVEPVTEPIVEPITEPTTSTEQENITTEENDQE